MLVFQHDGECGVSGIWSVITSSRGFGAALLNPPEDATHYVRYTTGSVASLRVNELLTGGTNHETARIVALVVEQGTVGATTEEGVIYVKNPSGAFTSEILTGGKSGGTVVINQDFIPLAVHSPAKAALITVESATLNFTTDGTTPTLTAGTNYGHQMTSGQSTVIRGWNNIRNFRAINAANGSGAILKYSMFY